MPQALSTQSLMASFMAATEKGSLPELSEEEIAALYGVAYQLYRNGKYEDAKQFFRFLTLANTFDRRVWMGLGACYHMLKEYSAAIECYSVAAIQNPDDPYTHWHASECFLANGQTAQGLEALQSAISVASQTADHAAFLEQLELVQSAWTNSIYHQKEAQQ